MVQTKKKAQEKVASGNMDIRAIALNVLYEKQNDQSFEAEEVIPENASLSEMINTFSDILDKIEDKNLSSTSEARNLKAMQKMFASYKDDPVMQKIFETIQDNSDNGKTLAETQKEIIAMYGGSDDDKESKKIDAESLKKLTSYLWLVQQTWEKMLKLRSSGKGSDNYYAVVATLLGALGLSGLVASSVWLHDILTNGTSAPGTTANQVVNGKTVVPDNAAVQPTETIPTQTDAGVSGSTGNSGSSATPAAPTDAANTIAQGNATSADAIAKANADSAASNANANTNAQAGAGTAITVCILLLLVTAYLLYLYYK